jgi:HEAT repeat protein
VNALTALGRIGPKAKEAVPALGGLVKGKEEPLAVRSQAAIALGQIGPDAKEAVPALEKALEDRTLAGPAKKALEKIRAERPDREKE